MEKKEEEEGRETTRALPLPFPLYGDILDSVVSHMPTLDLLPASHVSSTWHIAVASSLRCSPRLKPFLILYPQSPHRRRHMTSSLAFDPHSRTWAPLPTHAPLTSSPIRSSLPSLLFSLSPSGLSLSRAHPFSPATWLHLPLPRVSRVDPVIAIVGPSFVIAGAGAFEFEDLPGAVEVLNLDNPSAGWALRDPLPDPFTQSSSATWLSVATSHDRLFVLDKDSALFSSFDPQVGKWSPTCKLKPNPTTRLSAIGFSHGRLVLVGLSGEGHDPITMRMWEVGLDSDSGPVGFKEIGRMPQGMVDRLTGSGFGLTSIGFGLVGDFGYFYNPGDFREGAVFWEIGKGRWERVERPDALDEDPTARIVFGCARVDVNWLCGAS